MLKGLVYSAVMVMVLDLRGWEFDVSWYVVVIYQVSEMAVSELPGNPNAVWTVKRNMEGEIVR